MTFDGAGRRASPGSASTDAATGMAGSGARSRTGPRYAVQRRAAATGAEPAAAPARGRLLVDDGPLGRGQMLRADFLEQASTALRHATQQDLGPLAALGSPYLDQVLARLHAPGSDLEATLAELVPAAHDVDSATALIPMVVEHVRAESRARDTGQRAEGPARDAEDATQAAARPPAAPAAPAAPTTEIEARPVMTPAIEALITHVDQIIAGATKETVVRRVNARLDQESRQRAQGRRAGTAPDLTGVGMTDTLDTIAAGIRPLQRDWSALEPQARRDRMKDAANQGLAAATVPPVVDAVESPKRSKAAFNFHGWELWVGRVLTDAGTLDDHAAGELCSTVAHEARHAEQYFLSARFAAAGGATASKIAEDLQIPGDIALQAHARRLDGAPPAVIALAEEMHGATFVDRAANREINGRTGYEALQQAHDAALRSLDRLREWPSSTNAQLAREACAQLEYAVREVETLHVQYRAMPHEADAHEVGEAAQLAFEMPR